MSNSHEIHLSATAAHLVQRGHFDKDEVYKKLGASPFAFADEKNQGRRVPSSSLLPNAARSYVRASLSRLTRSHVCELISIALLLIGLSYGPMLIVIGTKRLKAAASSGTTSLGLDTARFYNASYGQSPLQLQLVRSNNDASNRGASSPSVASYLSLADSMTASERWDRLEASVAAWENDPNAADFEGFSVGCGSLPNGCSVAGCLAKNTVLEVQALLPSPKARLNASSLFSGATPAAQTSPAACPSQYRAATLQKKVESYRVPKSLLEYFSDQRGGEGDDNVVTGTSTHLAGLGVLISDPPLATRAPTGVTLTASPTSTAGTSVRQWFNITTVPRVGFSFPNVAYFEEDIPYMRPVSVLMRCERTTNNERKGSGNPYAYCSHVAMADRCTAMANWGHPNQTFVREAIASVAGSQPTSSLALNEATYVPLYQLESLLLQSSSSSFLQYALSSAGCGVGQVCGTCSWLEYLQQYCVVVKPKPMPRTSSTITQYERDWSYGSCRYPFVKEQLPATAIPPINPLNGFAYLATFVFDDKNQYQRSLSAAIAKLFGPMSAPMMINAVDSVGPLNRNNRHPDYSTVHVQYPQILMRKASDPVLEIERLTLGTSGRSSQTIIVSGTSASGASRPTVRTTSYGQTATAFAASTITVGASAIAVSLLTVLIGCGCFAEYFRFGDLRSSSHYSSGLDTEESDDDDNNKKDTKRGSTKSSSVTKRRRTAPRKISDLVNNNKSAAAASSNSSDRRPHKREDEKDNYLQHSPYGNNSNTNNNSSQPQQRRIWHNLESILSRGVDRQKQNPNQQQHMEEMGGAASSASKERAVRDLRHSSSSPSSPAHLHSPRSPRETTVSGARRGARSPPRNGAFRYGYTPFSTDAIVRHEDKV